jgi:hypothetical protein
MAKDQNEDRVQQATPESIPVAIQRELNLVKRDVDGVFRF